MAAFKDLSGQQFGYLTALYVDPFRVGKHTYWVCKCVCGNMRDLQTHQLTSGRVTSCGCKNPRTKLSNVIRGRKRMYDVYVGMLSRCYNPNNISYKYYGGKGITICDEWKEDFSAFSEWAEQNGYEDTLSIDRIDNSKGYGPTNCRWVPLPDQFKNKQSNVCIEHDGERRIMNEWCRILGFSITLAKSRCKYAKQKNIPITFEYIFAPKKR